MTTRMSYFGKFWNTKLQNVSKRPLFWHIPWAEHLTKRINRNKPVSCPCAVICPQNTWCVTLKIVKEKNGIENISEHLTLPKHFKSLIFP